jgi:hypothetical protein
MNVYLTPEKKSYYINELNKAKTINDSNWDVDNGLIDVLDCINENPNIQTLLSKKSEDLRIDNNSYLHFTYSRKVIHSLNILIPLLYAELKSLNSIFTIIHRKANEYKGKTNKFNISNNISKLDAVSNVEKYTNINCFIIEITSFDNEAHNKFWELLKKRLNFLK